MSNVISFTEYRKKKENRINELIEKAIFRDGGERADYNTVMENQLLRMYYKLEIMDGSEADILLRYITGETGCGRPIERMWNVCKSALANPVMLDNIEENADRILMKRFA